MKKIRIIPRLDIKGPNVIKGIHLEGLRIIGQPAELAKKYYDQGADEILYIDIVASLYGRENIREIVKATTSRGVFIPITVGGGVRTLSDIKELLRAGADKVAINSFAIKNPKFITEASRAFGTQCIVGSIEAKKNNNSWEAYIENGREKTGVDAIAWAKKLVELGAGELLITSIDQEGTEQGYDLELIKKIAAEVSVPVIACGGAKDSDDVVRCLEETKCDAIALASILHYNKTTVGEIKKKLKTSGFEIRDKNRKEHSLKKKKKRKISIIDYGLGNLRSVVKGFEKNGNVVDIINTPKDISDAENLVLPGVGAFADGMEGLKKRGLIEPIKKHVKLKKPLLGICLGTQLFFSESDEFGTHQGLDLIKGRVVKFSKPNFFEKKYLIPHIGWNSISFSKKFQKENKILEEVPNNSEMYFVHSFFPVPEHKENILATTTYGDQEFCSFVKKENIYGCQFHPEKSGKIGLKILENFGEIS